MGVHAQMIGSMIDKEKYEHIAVICKRELFKNGTTYLMTYNGVIISQFDVMCKNEIAYISIVNIDRPAVFHLETERFIWFCINNLGMTHIHLINNGSETNQRIFDNLYECYFLTGNGYNIVDQNGTIIHQIPQNLNIDPNNWVHPYNIDMTNLSIQFVYDAYTKYLPTEDIEETLPLTRELYWRDIYTIWITLSFFGRRNSNDPYWADWYQDRPV